MRNVLIMGAGGRDFHDFDVVYRNDPDTNVVAFTAAQIPGIDDRVYPASLAGQRYPQGIPVRPEAELADLVRELAVDEVVFAYSDVPHEEVMHRASIALAAGADFTLLGPRSTMLPSSKPVVAVCAVRTGSGKSQTSRRVGRILLDAGLKVALVRHPMPYHDLEAMRVQRFATLEDIDASRPTIEEREEYEPPIALGMVMYAGVDYAAILARAAGGGRRDRLGRRQQRLPVLPPRPADRRRRPAARRRRAPLPPGRDEPPHGRRRRRQQDRQRGRGRRSSACSRTSPRSTLARR